ncbi:MAG: PKD domain-containing protein [Planctomycetes bacterium]|nr:PKD domain-containing protein [Planctomycetota bacterium]
MLGSVRARLALAAVFALLVLDTAAAQSAPAVASRARTLQVGPTRLYKKPSEAAAVALDGDIVEIDAGIYLGDACAWTRHNLILRGVGTGRAHLIANGAHAQGKGTWVISGTNATVENIEFSGAAVPDKNGAGIRQEGAGLTVRRCSFHDNQNGILTSANAASDILIEFSEFYANGYGDGLTHNMYIGKVRTFTLRHCHTYRAKVGHLIKSRAETNYILYNRITCEATGTTSYEINLPNGGRSYVIGNLIQQGPSAGNSTLLSYAEEGATNAVQELYVVHNTFVNERTAGGTFVRVSGTPAQSKLINNIFAGPGTVLSGTGTQTTNLASSSPGLVNASGYDYRLTATSPALNAGSNPGTGGGYNLTPVYQYVHPLNREARTANGAPDLGAYESGAPAPNTAPVVDAGPARTITLPSTASLDGTVTDDGKPSGTLTQNWTKVSGPGTVTFANASAVDTTASFSVAGTYSLRLTASDSALSASDTVTVTVNAAPAPNRAPVVESDPFAAPNPAAIAQSVSFTALAADSDGDALTYAWTFGDGASASGSSVAHAYAAAGTFNARVTISDGRGGSVSRTLAVSVAQAPVEKVKLSGRVNFAVAERDSCSVSGYIAWPEGRTAEGARVELDVGGVRVAGALDDRGSVKVGLHTLRVIVPRRPGPARFVATLKAGVFAPAWVNEGVTNADARRVPLTFLVRLKVDALVFESADPVLYTARAGKTGSFR